MYSKIYRNSVSYKAIILHLINNLIISALAARAVDRVASRAEAFLAGQMPCHAQPWRRHWGETNDSIRYIEKVHLFQRMGDWEGTQATIDNGLIQILSQQC